MDFYIYVQAAAAETCERDVDLLNMYDSLPMHYVCSKANSGPVGTRPTSEIYGGSKLPPKLKCELVTLTWE